MRSYRILLHSTLVLLGIFPIAGIGNSIYNDLRSPIIMGGGALITESNSPQLDSLNPATAGLRQRFILDLNYIFLGLDKDQKDKFGHVINLGTTIPTKVGVFTLSTDFVTTPKLAALNFGTQFDIRSSFSKEVYPGFLVGLGLAGSFGEGWGVTGNIGVTHYLDPDGENGNVRWSLAFQDLGYYDKDRDTPPTNSISGGIAFSPVNTVPFRLDIGVSAYSPSFSDLSATFGIGLTFFDTISLHTASRFSITSIVERETRRMLPSVGLTYTYRSKRPPGGNKATNPMFDWRRSEVSVTSGAIPLPNELWGFGLGVTVPFGSIDTTPPSIEIDTSNFRFPEYSEEPDEKPEDDGRGDSGNNAEEAEKTSNISVPDTMRVAVVDRPSTDKLTGTTKLKRVYPVQEEVRSPQKVEVKGSDGENETVQIIEYISPNNDGINDILELPLSITDVRYLSGFSLKIEDSEGNEVRTLANKDERPENRGFTGFFARLFSIKRGITVPDVLRWDGTSNSGELVPDGHYQFYVQAWDDNGNIGSSDRLGIAVDTTPPELLLSPPEGTDLIFSPDGDGFKEVLPIGLGGSTEDLWSISISMIGGEEVFSSEVRDSAPVDFSWDGRGNLGELVLDGVYQFQISSTDRAGNQTSRGFDNIIINTTPTPVSLSISHDSISPQNSTATSNLKFGLDVPVKNGVIRWQLRIHNAQGEEVARFGENAVPPEEYTYDGLSDTGHPLSEGHYTGQLSLEYSNGARPTADSAAFVVDITPPRSEVTSEYTVFSPNGDGRKDVMRLFQESSQENRWVGEIEDGQGEVIRSFEWFDYVDSVVEWDGYTDLGSIAGDGTYFYRTHATDRAGNYGASGIVQIKLDTEETPVLLLSDFEAFSPNGDGVKDLLTLTPIARITEGIDQMRFEIATESGDIVKVHTRQSGGSSGFAWDGFSDSGRVVEDGNYRARLEVVYDKGNVSSAVSRPFLIDSTFPKIEVESGFNLFSPDGDGLKDVVEFRHTFSSEMIWKGEIRSQNGAIVRSFLWEEMPKVLEWAGTDNNGNRLPDGRYSYTVSTEDPGGNYVEATVSSIEIDTKPVSVYITASTDRFNPTEPGESSSVTLNTIIPEKEGIRKWSVDIKDSDDAIIRSYSDQRLPSQITWDGRVGDGPTRVKDGHYTATIVLEYNKGSRPTATTSKFSLDSTPPVLDIAFEPKPFSPDNDGVEDELLIRPIATDLTEVVEWKLEFFDRTERLFKTFLGTGTPSSLIRWDGRGDSGELVTSAEDYGYRYSAHDPLGNSRILTGSIPVDVLVVRYGDLLKIQIASIQFAPNSPKLSEESEEVIQRNTSVLVRLIEILKKYDSYGITIEGHAASLFWRDPERARIEEVEELKPLSLDRARTVKAYLVEFGIPSARIDTIGVGGLSPVVPHSDEENRWKNRRVEFILEK